MGRVVVIGSINTDLNILADRLPSPGETVLGGDFFQAPGGKGANQAVAAARAGADVMMVGAVGRDAFGDAGVRGLAADGIDTTFVRRSECPSGIALIMIGAGGENMIVVAPGANHDVSAVHVDAAASAFHGCNAGLLQLEIPIPTAWHAVRALKQAGVHVLLNPAPAPAEPLPGDVLEAVDVLIPNEGELERLSGRTVAGEKELVAAAQSLLDRGVGAVAVTLGSRGVFAVSPDGAEWHMPFRAEPVDTVGAGDCFCGALAAALADDAAFDEAIRFAQAAAAISVTRRGAQPSMPRRAEIEALLEHGDPS